VRLEAHGGQGEDKSCALMCVKKGKFVFADQDHKTVCQLEKVGQEKAGEFAGQKVKVTGFMTGKTIRVTAIEAVNYRLRASAETLYSCSLEPLLLVCRKEIRRSRATVFSGFRFWQTFGRLLADYACALINLYSVNVTSLAA